MKVILEVNEVLDLAWGHIKKKQLLGCKVDYNKLVTRLQMEDDEFTGCVVGSIEEPEAGEK